MTTTEGQTAGMTPDDTAPEWNLRPSDYLETVDLGEGEYIVWNRFYPVPTLLNEAALDVLRGSVEGFSAEELEQCRTLFLNKKLAYEGDRDPSRDGFLQKIDEFTGNLRSRDDSSRDYYRSLEISNDPCNVGCTYCMIPKFKAGADELVKLGRKPPPAKSKMTRPEKLEALKKVVDRYIQTRLASGVRDMPIGMSGGELLAQWPLIQGLIEYVAERYPEASMSWNMNSSLTILTEEQAEFLGKHGVKVNTSIDGYKENHDKHRVYHNGKGTFDDVLAGVERYNQHSAEPLRGFQGTIAQADEFDANKMFEFARSRFETARMAPNLLGVSEEEGEKQADLMMDLHIAGQEVGFEFNDLIFQHLKTQIQAKGNKPFSLYCTAMSNTVARSHVGVNITTMQASRSCSFVPSAHVPLEELDFDIFSEALWQQNLSFAQERADTIKKHCMGCEIAGACHGACVLSGIDANNQLNKGGCAYLRRLWRRLSAHLLDRNERIPSKTAHPVRLSELVATGSGEPAPAETAE
jgi:radical SAM protein with 4Fe4S-binding SPASM domain